MQGKRKVLPDGVKSSYASVKRPRGAVAVGTSRNTGSIRIKDDPEASLTMTSQSMEDTLREEFIALFSEPAYQRGVPNSGLKAKFGDRYIQLVPIINDLTRKSRLNMSKMGDEIYYNIVSEDIASKFVGLDVSSRMVYQVIEKAGNMGIWTKDIRTQTAIQQQALTKIFKALETRKLIKPVKVRNLCDLLSFGFCVYLFFQCTYILMKHVFFFHHLILKVLQY